MVPADCLTEALPWSPSTIFRTFVVTGRSKLKVTTSPDLTPYTSESTAIDGEIAGGSEPLDPALGAARISIKSAGASVNRAEASFRGASAMNVAGFEGVLRTTLAVGRGLVSETAVAFGAITSSALLNC